jgi:hypothetical protein
MSIGSFLDTVTKAPPDGEGILMVYFRFFRQSLPFLLSRLPALAFLARQIVMRTRHTNVRSISLFPHELYANRLLPDPPDDFVSPLLFISSV